MVLQSPLAGSSQCLCEAVMRWCQYNEEIRVQHLYKLLTMVNLPLLSADFVRQVVQTNELVISCARSNHLVQSVVKLLSNRWVYM